MTDALTSGPRTAKRLDSKLKLVCLASGSVSVKGIRRILKHWESETVPFIADVIVIDYADNLSPEDSNKDFRTQQHDRWQALRALAQERKCAVITATQADAASYGAYLLKPKNFSEDKRKYGHTTMFLTLNQTDDEKANGILRIGKMFVRGDDADYRKTITVLECRAIGQIIISSYENNFKSNMQNSV